MALIKCVACGHRISDKAIQCPACGSEQRKQPKKESSISARSIAWLMGLASLPIGLAFCIHSPASNNDAPSQARPAVSTPETKTALAPQSTNTTTSTTSNVAPTASFNSGTHHVNAGTSHSSSGRWSSISIRSNNSVQIKDLFSKKNAYATFVVKRSSTSQLDMVVRTSAGKVACAISCRVDLWFDNAASISVRASQSGSGLNLSDEQSIMRKIRASRRMQLVMDFSGNGRKTYEFDLRGNRWD